MKYKWGGLLEAVEEADGKHENEKLEKAQKLIKALEETINIRQVEKILIFLKEYQDFLCSTLLDDLFRCKYYFPSSYIQFIEIGNLELCRFLFDKFGPEFTKYLCRDESEALGKASLEIIRFFMERGIGHDDNNLFGMVIASGDLKKVEYVLPFMSKPLHTIPWLGYSGIMSFETVKYIFDALDVSLQPEFLKRVMSYHSFDIKTFNFLTQNIPEDIDYIAILNNCLIENNLDLLKNIRDKFTDIDFLNAIRNTYVYRLEETNICIQYLVENNHTFKQMIKNALPSFLIREASKEEIEKMLQNESDFTDIRKQIFTEKCIEYQLTNTNNFYRFLCKDVKNLRHMFSNKPELIDIDKCIERIMSDIVVYSIV